jgi:dethiobiotin synthetase
MAASNVTPPYKSVNPIALAPPIAPHIAADEAGIELSAQELAHHCRRQLNDADFSLVEGAGGWLVPLNAEETLADLAIVLGLPVILVVSLKLGCINHALLTALSIEQSGLTLAGWVANDSVQPMARRQQNIETLTQRIEAPCLAELPRCQPEEAANRLDLDTLLG